MGSTVGRDVEIGTKYNKLTIKEVVGRTGGKLRVRCACDCGGEITTLFYRVRVGLTKSCGCLHRAACARNGAKSRVQVPEGTRYGRLVVLRQTTRTAASGKKHAYLFCRCDCGTEREFSAANLKNGTTKSCGCLAKEMSSERESSHGHTRGNKTSPEYAAYHAMLQRCYNEKNEYFQHYGGRGISVCSEWRESFESFLRDMGERPGRGYSLDRIDVDGDYCPENCRWATVVTQMNNQRRNRRVTLFGEEHTVAEWCRRYDRQQATVSYRLHHGYSPYEAIVLERRFRPGEVVQNGVPLL